MILWWQNIISSFYSPVKEIAQTSAKPVLCLMNKSKKQKLFFKRNIYQSIFCLGGLLMRYNVLLQPAVMTISVYRTEKPCPESRPSFSISLSKSFPCCQAHIEHVVTLSYRQRALGLRMLVEKKVVSFQET